MKRCEATSLGSSHSRPRQKHVEPRSRYQREFVAWPEQVSFFLALRDLRNIQVAHSLIPWNDPTDQLWAHHLLEFAEVVFDFAITLEAALAEATGVTLKDLRKNADAFEASAGQFWRALTTLKFLADGEPPS